MPVPGIVGRILENLDGIEAMRYRLSDETGARNGGGRAGFLVDFVDVVDCVDAP